MENAKVTKANNRADHPGAAAPRGGTNLTGLFSYGILYLEVRGDEN